MKKKNKKKKEEKIKKLLKNQEIKKEKNFNFYMKKIKN